MRNKIAIFIATCIIAFNCCVCAQNYPAVLNYNFNGTPVNGVKIKTNLPFLNYTQMPTITLEGYNYGTGQTISITLVWYIFDGTFINCSASSQGSYTPEIMLSNEEGKVIIFINDKQYFQRFTIRAYAQGIQETSHWFQSWSTADEALRGNNTVTVPYKNNFAGNVGIGTTTPSEKLSVNGNIRCKKVIVTQTDWADYVFDSSYNLPSLESISSYIKENKRLPEMPSASAIERAGHDLGEVQTLLLKKVEEMTLYILQLKQENEDAKKRIEILEVALDKK
ncbi:tail fiber protein [Danxiaibacter flavus]|uniref:Tail fiber protein n=1 Tax=Danxiaibacter flavus TaxID=3049108 RepID=A0ABV3ZK98_9BACT|nr:tail fiber protein [Chitinophagaceae bacterium DXS]